MNGFLKWLRGFFEKAAVPNQPPEVSVSVPITATGYTKPVDNTPRYRDPVTPLSMNFALGELTYTDHVDLRTENRTLTDAQVESLKQLCLRVLEPCRSIVKKVTGTEGLFIHDGMRVPALNKAVGGVSDSQHVLAQAADWTPAHGSGVEQLQAIFQAIWDAAKRGDIEFGQLILENAREGSGVARWIHCSLGKGYRDTEKCGEVLTRDVEGKYVMLGRVSDTATA